MALDVAVHDFIRHIGHDGGEIAWPTLKEPSCRRGFHVQECIDIAYRCGFAVTPFEVLPRHAPAFTVPAQTILFGGSEEAAFTRFAQIIFNGKGVITGHCNTVCHAVAYDRGLIFDPCRSAPYHYHKTTCERYGFIGYCAWQLERRTNVQQ
jgi:hypothetical protein